MNGFNIQITNISGPSWVIKPDMIEVPMESIALDKAQRIVNSMIENGVDESTIKSAFPAYSFVFFQSTDHLEKNDIMDRPTKIGDDGKTYVARDPNYKVFHADIKIDRDGAVVLEFPIDKTSERLICPIGTINALRSMCCKTTTA